jgi:hypothetical protein
MASSEILTPHPLTARRVCTPPPLVWGEETLAGWRGGRGSIVRKRSDTALYAIYVKYFVVGSLGGVPRISYNEFRGFSPLKNIKK